MSKRTDGGPSKPMYVADRPYGEGQAFMDTQTAAPMGGPDSVDNMPAPTGGPGAPLPRVGFGDPTQRPDEPVTAGNPLGPGPGPRQLSSNLTNMSRREVQQIASYLPSLEAVANSDAATDSFRRFVRYLRAAAQ